MNKKEKGWEFWSIVGFMVGNFAILVTIVGFMLSMSVRMDNMATKADIARLETDIARLEANIATKADKTDIIDIRNLLIRHITDGHKHKKKERQPDSVPAKSSRK